MEQTLNLEELDFLKEAKNFLEKESLLIKLANTVGKPVDTLLKALPQKAERSVSSAVEKSLLKALNLALKTIQENQNPQPKGLDIFQSQVLSHNSRRLHTGLGVMAGVGGGAFGLPGLIVELPVTTTLIMRSILETALRFNFSKEDSSLPLECLAVFTMGSRQSVGDDQMDTSYYSSRIALAESLRASASFVAKNSSQTILKSIENKSAPVLIKFIHSVASRFQINVSQKMVAGSLPIIGAVSAASINYIFMDYYAKVARYHFGILALEKKYGKDLLERSYSSIMA